MASLPVSIEACYCGIVTRRGRSRAGLYCKLLEMVGTGRENVWWSAEFWCCIKPQANIRVRYLRLSFCQIDTMTLINSPQLLKPFKAITEVECLRKCLRRPQSCYHWHHPLR